jgi:putative DNA primase/helicase
MKFNVENIPYELQELKQWVCWRKVIADNGKTTKIPINPSTGKNAMSNNPNTWTNLLDAVYGNTIHDLDGIGFMLENGYFGIDLDDCDEALKNEFITHMQSYTEISQSGNGIHIICKGTLPKGKRRTKGIEMYETGRFFVMTGNTIGDYPIIDGTEKIKYLHEKYLEPKTKKTKKTEQHQAEAVVLDDNDILVKAQNSKNGAAFKMLFDGEWEALNYPSQSEADLALCNILAFWTGKNNHQMDRLFRMSGLYRDKWDRRQSGTTYGAITIQQAINNATSIYTSAYNDDSEIYVNAKTGEVSMSNNVSYDINETGNAQRLVDRYDGVIKYNFENKRWKIWNGQFWENDVTNKIKKYAEVVIEDMKVEALRTENETERKIKLSNVNKAYSSRGKEALIKEAQHIDNIPTVNAQYDNYDMLLNVENGIVDLSNGTVMEHQKEYMQSKYIPYSVDLQNEPTQWLRFMDEIFKGDKELIRFIQKAIGYTLTGSTQEQCLFIAYGDGSNGKSVFLDIINRMMGDYSVNAQVETILERKFGGGSYTSDLARLNGARFVTTGENNEGSKINEGLVKQLTGGEKITARFLYGMEFEFYPRFKLWIATNHKPIIRGTDSGIWRRIRAIPFTFKVDDKKRDRNLIKKLEKEIPQIIGWAIKGTQLWLKEGLEVPSVIKAAVQEYKNEMDIIGTFLDEHCEVGVDWETKANDLYIEYEKWAKQSNEYLMSKSKFGREMSKKFYKERRSFGYVYKGIKLNTASKSYVFDKYHV